jgi:hypothetical protein
VGAKAKGKESKERKGHGVARVLFLEMLFHFCPRGIL